MTLYDKSRRIRIQDWSAPSIMAALLLISILFIYSFESIGLLNKEKNLTWRIQSPEGIIKASQAKKVSIDGNSGNVNVNDNVLNFKIKQIADIDKEEHQKQMIKMLVDGVSYQMQMQNNNENNYNIHNIDNFYEDDSLISDMNSDLNKDISYLDI